VAVLGIVITTGVVGTVVTVYENFSDNVAGGGETISPSTNVPFTQVQFYGK
jgi:hypothetical protein